MGSKKKVKRPKKKKTLQQWLIPKLRKISLYWPEMNEALKRAKVKVQVGHFKNGKPKFKTFIKCESCDELFESEKDINRDHKVPVVDISGFENWDIYLNSLFCSSDNIQIICKPCHEGKTEFENEERTKVRQTNKKA